MSDLFISHSSSDNAAAREVERRLAEHGHHSVFLDFDPERGIAAGQSWERTLYARLRACRAVIVLCSDRYLASHWCFAEVALARMTGKHVFTLLVDGLGERTALPAMLTEQQCIDLRADREDGFRRLWRGLGEKGIEKTNARDWNPRDPPYPGLLAFDEGDAAIFFARDREIDEGTELLNRAHRFGHPRLVLVLGASGSGKSSLLRAGLVPRLRRDVAQWVVLDPFRPGPQPQRELAGALARALRSFGSSLSREQIEARLQGEEGVAAGALPSLAAELRLSSPHPQAKAGDRPVRGAARPCRGGPPGQRLPAPARAGADRRRGTLVAVAAMRSDYVDAFQHNAGIGGVEYHSLLLGPASEQGLREIIEKPAVLGAIELEPGLTEALLRDTGAADALPLLAFTLRLLWDRHHREGRIGVREYDAMERLQDAVAVEADRVLDNALRLGSEADLRRALLRMARITDDGSSFARQPVRWDDIPASVQPMLRLFVDHRLLTSRGDGSVEVSHEALFRSWRRLAGWLQEDRELLLWQKRMRGAAAEWLRTGEDSGALLHGRPLEEAQRWAAERPDALGPQEQRFVAASVAWRDRALQAEAQARERERAQQAAPSRGRAAACGAAAARQQDAEAQPRAPGGGTVIAVALTYWIGNLFYTLDRPVRALAFSSDGRTLAVANEDRKLKFWDVASGEPSAEPLEGEASRAGQWGAAAFSPDRRWLVAASAFGHGGVLWNLDQREETKWATGQEETITRVVFSPGGSLIAAACEDRSIALWDLRPGRLHGPLLTPGQGTVLSLAFSPNGKRLASGGSDRTVLLWDVETGRPVGKPTRDHDDAVSALAFSPDGKILASGGHDATVRLRNLATGLAVGAPAKVGRRVERLVFKGDGKALAASAYVTKKVFIWTVSENGLWGDPLETEDYPTELEFSPDGKLLAVGSGRGPVEIWDLAARKRQGRSLN